MRTALLPLVLAGCAGPAGPSSSALDTAASDEFCATLADGGATTTLDEGGNASSGMLSIRVLTSESTDPRDPQFVAFKDYTLENMDSGGVKTTGKTSGDGLVDELLGAGNWHFSAAHTRGSMICLAELDVVVAADQTTFGCPVMECP